MWPCATCRRLCGGHTGAPPGEFRRSGAEPDAAPVREFLFGPFHRCLTTSLPFLLQMLPSRGAHGGLGNVGGTEPVTRNLPLYRPSFLLGFADLTPPPGNKKDAPTKTAGPAA